MEKDVKRIYLDTNVLAYVANTKAPQHSAALEVFRPSKREQLCVSSQVMMRDNRPWQSPPVKVV